jgi:hypothetical protein
VGTKLRRLVLPRRGLLDHALDALGRKALLRERNAAIEHLAITRDLSLMQCEVGDALEATGLPSAPGILER